MNRRDGGSGRNVLRKLQEDWEELAQMDMLFSILSEPESKFGNWDLNEFFLTGQEEIAGVMQLAGTLGLPADRDLALDFGCGAGRLTRALAAYFHRTCGLDISKTMIDAAREYNRSIPGCEFVVQSENNLNLFADGQFDMVYTRYVLQHIPSKSLIKTYITELVRVLKIDGLLVFQVPGYVPPKNRIQPRRRAYALLRKLGLRHRFLYENLALDPIVSNYLPEEEVTALLKGCGASCLDIQRDADAGPASFSRVYYVSKS